MGAARLNYVIVHQGQSQVYGCATKNVALESPLPDGAKAEDRMILYMTYQPDTDHLSVHKLSDEEVQAGLLKGVVAREALLGQSNDGR